MATATRTLVDTFRGPEARARNDALVAKLAAMTMSEVKALADADVVSLGRMKEMCLSTGMQPHPNAMLYANRVLQNMSAKDEAEVYELLRADMNRNGRVGCDFKSITLSEKMTAYRSRVSREIRAEATRDRLRLKLRRTNDPAAL
jgi:hypothetical protein